MGVDALPGFRAAGPAPAATWESAFIVMAAVIFGTSVIEIFLSMGSGGTTYPAQVWLVFFAVYAVFGLLFVRSKGAVFTLFTSVPLLALVLAFPFVSILWSSNPGETFERGIAMLGCSLLGLYLGWRFTLGRIIYLLAMASVISVVLSMAMILLVPSVGIAQSGSWAGTWVGVHLHKNGLGSSAALACLIIGYAITDSRGRRRLALCCAFMLAFVLLIGSRSTTSLLAVLVIGPVAMWARYVQVLPKHMPVISLVVVIGIMVVGVQFISSDQIEGVLGYFGKEPDLSSRLPLWGLVWSYIENRFWWGYGYEAFWHPSAPPVRLMQARLYFTPHYSHNGLLETWLNGGIVLVGLILLLLCGMLIRASIIFVRWREIAISSFPLFYCTYFIMINLTESLILARNNLAWALFVMNAIFLTKWVRMRVF